MKWKGFIATKREGGTWFYGITMRFARERGQAYYAFIMPRALDLGTLECVRCCPGVAERGGFMLCSRCRKVEMRSFCLWHSDTLLLLHCVLHLWLTVLTADQRPFYAPWSPYPVFPEDDPLAKSLHHESVLRGGFSTKTDRCTLYLAASSVCGDTCCAALLSLGLRPAR